MPKKKPNHSYFDADLYNKIVAMCDIDINEGLRMFESYVSKYSNDYMAYMMYACNLIKIGKIEEAEKIVEYVEKYQAITTKYEKVKHDYFKQNLLFLKIKLLCYQGKYQECLDLISINKAFLLNTNLDLGLIVNYCCVKLGLPLAREKDDDSYIFKQFIKYSDDLFKEHISKHLISTTDAETSAVFYQDFPVEKVMEEIKKLIPDSKHQVMNGFFDSEYYFKFDNCGRALKNNDRRKDKQNKNTQLDTRHTVITDYFGISTFYNTSEIITMYPCEGPKGFPYFDLNYLKEEKEPVKRKSMIDKFNERYKNY